MKLTNEYYTTKYEGSVMITRDELVKLLDYDPVTGVFRWKVARGRLAKAGSDAGTVHVHRGKSYRYIKINGKLYLSHRLAWLVITGEFPENEIDHRDGNGLNNAAANLRAVSRTENCKNQRRPVNNKSGVMGVSWHKACAKWHAQIMLDGKQKYLGLFVDFDEAVAVRKNAERKLGFSPNHGSTRPL